ncbi:MAG: hypothetical protein KF851_09825 [Pirellulaceae bacterium]|jgi:hypothetical protein|nr:hypothetical protein [Pirellulaceae bacterium]
MIAELKTQYEIESLRSQQGRREKMSANLDLWILCQDGPVTFPVQRVLEAGQSLVLQRSHSVWQGLVEDCQGEDETMNYAINELGVTDLMVCVASPGNVRNWLNETHWEGPPRSGAKSLLERIKERERTNQKLQQSLLECVETIAQVPVVAKAVIQQRLNIHAIFFHSESGTFQRFDSMHGQFRAIA